jgi:hypothetical protein
MVISNSCQNGNGMHTLIVIVILIYQIQDAVYAYSFLNMMDSLHSPTRNDNTWAILTTISHRIHFINSVWWHYWSYISIDKVPGVAIYGFDKAIQVSLRNYEFWLNKVKDLIIKMPNWIWLDFLFKLEKVRRSPKTAIYRGLGLVTCLQWSDVTTPASATGSLVFCTEPTLVFYIMDK